MLIINKLVKLVNKIILTVGVGMTQLPADDPSLGIAKRTASTDGCPTSTHADLDATGVTIYGAIVVESHLPADTGAPLI